MVIQRYYRNAQRDRADRLPVLSFWLIVRFQSPTKFHSMISRLLRHLQKVNAKQELGKRTAGNSQALHGCTARLLRTLCGVRNEFARASLSLSVVVYRSLYITKKLHAVRMSDQVLTGSFPISSHNDEIN
jgi:hypothetical protein